MPVVYNLDETVEYAFIWKYY